MNIRCESLFAWSEGGSESRYFLFYIYHLVQSLEFAVVTRLRSFLVSQVR